mmetsp:Transcript_4540/g.9228  ORF Transcript_4540/g.9228 Transcript_4540/m.9228 type:complete len:102 (-) Transcript_4540:7-312(-)
MHMMPNTKKDNAGVFQPWPGHHFSVSMAPVMIAPHTDSRTMPLTTNPTASKIGLTGTSSSRSSKRARSLPTPCLCSASISSEESMVLLSVCLLCLAAFLQS